MSNSATENETTNRSSKRTRSLRNKEPSSDIQNFIIDGRKKRKAVKKLKEPSLSLYDAKGIFKETGEDLCDCLDKACEGCHFPCPRCNSTKCATVCRNNREWAFESVEREGDVHFEDEKEPPKSAMNNYLSLGLTK